jgi:GTP-dependent dephospho-CoA kinase
MPPAGTRSASSDPTEWVVPPSLRARLAARYGPVLSGAAAEDAIRALDLFASCGDRVTADAIRLGHLPLVGVVDGKTQRQEPVELAAFAPLRARAVRRVTNPAGVLTVALRRTVAELIRSGGGLLEVDGEEDLASLALVESLPAGATVIYGIPGAGVSFVTVDAAAKQRVQALIAAMEPR